MTDGATSFARRRPGHLPLNQTLTQRLTRPANVCHTWWVTMHAAYDDRIPIVASFRVLNLWITSDQHSRNLNTGVASDQQWLTMSRYQFIQKSAVE